MIENRINSVDKTRMFKSGALAGEYLLNVIRQDGSFVYEVNARSGKQSDGYNILRHAGSLYSVYQGRSYFPWLEEKQQAINLAYDYLTRQVHEVEINNRFHFCVLEKNEIKLGGLCLTVIALLERFIKDPLPADKKLLIKLGDFIIWMQNSDGKFRSKYSFPDFVLGEFESVYYPGQAILALTRLFLLDNNHKWLIAAKKGARFLLKNPVLDPGGNRGHNHWFVIALSELCKISPDEDLYMEMQKIVDSTSESMQQQLLVNSKKMNGNPFSTAAMATRCEAIASAVILDLHLQSPYRVEERIDVLQRGITFCLHQQITDHTPSKDSLCLTGGIKKDALDDNIRIDYVQHTLSAITGLLHIDKVIGAL